MDTLISSLLHLANSYSTPLGVIIGLLAFEAVSRVLNGAKYPSPEPYEAPSFNCPHCLECRTGAGLGCHCRRH
jgi:hypothetical protein